MDSSIWQDLRILSTVVCIEPGVDFHEEMLESYLIKPKPVIWGNFYEPVAGETHLETVSRCYPNLLEWRSDRYRDMAHVVLPFETTKPLEVSGNLLDLIRSELTAA